MGDAITKPAQKPAPKPAAKPAKRSIGWAVILALSAGLAAPVAPLAATTEGPPPPRGARCVKLDNIDWRRFANDQRRRAAPPEEQAGYDAQLQASIDLATIPDGAAHRPSPEALIVIRAYIPTHRYYTIEDRAVTWREPDGQWWFWRQRLDWGAPPPPPPPPPVDLQPGESWTSPPPPTMDERFPPVSGPLNARFAALLEDAFNDPCRVWEPTRAASPLPLRRAEEGDTRRERWCPHGAAPVMGEITEQGGQPRVFFYPCDMDFSSRLMLTYTAYATAPDAAEQRVMERLARHEATDEAEAPQ